jgi:hemerythrin
MYGGFSFFMENDVIVSWQDSYSIGVALVDAQHKELINLTNALYGACKKGVEFSRPVFLKTIQGAVEYVGYHFSTEEKMMTRTHYPGYPEHKKQHEDFVRTVLQEVENFTGGGEFSPESFVFFLRDWVLNHIARTDTKMGKFLLDLEKNGAPEAGLIPDEAAI